VPVELSPDGLEPDGLTVVRVGSVPFEPVKSRGGLAREQRDSGLAGVPDVSAQVQAVEQGGLRRLGSAECDWAAELHSAVFRWGVELGLVSPRSGSARADSVRSQDGRSRDAPLVWAAAQARG
jgi:hypothetical protein